MRETCNSNNKTESYEGRYLCFSLGKEQFAIPLLQVKEVIGNVKTTSIPQSPTHFVGIINLRGQVISIIDLRVKLKIGKAEATPETTIIILDFDGLSLGMIVDTINCVSLFDEKDLSTTPNIESTSAGASYITGVVKTGKTLTLLLDLKAALNAEDFKTLKSQNQKAA